MKKIEDMKGLYNGRKAIVMGNGPSLDNLDFSLLKKNKDIITFSTNQVADICKKNDWFPNFYTSFFCEPLRGKPYSFPDGTSTNYGGSYDKALKAQEDIKYITSNKETSCFVHEWYRKFIFDEKGVNFIKPHLWNRHVDFPENGFDKFKIPNKFLWHVATTPLFQLCFFFGFKKIAIIGQDGYKSQGENHFSNYKGHELKTEEHINRANRKIHLLQNAVKRHAEKNEVDIYNLSTVSIINQHIDVNLDEFIML